MNRKDAVLPLTLAMAFLGIALMFVARSGPNAFDQAVLSAVTYLRSQPLTYAAVFLTELGWAPVALLFSILAWCRSNMAALHMAIATIGSEVILQILKLAIARPRPEGILPLVDSYGYSFPSGHSVVAAATYTTAAIILRRRLRGQTSRKLAGATAVLTIALVAMSRVYLGVHYASDAIGGVLLGTAWAFILAQRWYDSRKV